MQTASVLYEGLTTNNKEMIQKAISELDYHMAKTTTYQATLGGMWKALSDASSRLQGEEVEAKAALSKAEDADIFDATSQFKRTEATLQGTLQASTKLLQPSLLNFLQ
jgi:flagellar hook-associated protein 3 FlgL